MDMVAKPKVKERKKPKDIFDLNIDYVRLI